MADDPAGRENGAALSSSNHLLDRVPPDERARMDDRLEPVLLEGARRCAGEQVQAAREKAQARRSGSL